MRIYYFGELIQDTNETKIVNKKELEIVQTTLEFDTEETTKKPRTIGMESIGDLLRDLDLNLDVYRPMKFGSN